MPWSWKIKLLALLVVSVNFLAITQKGYKFRVLKDRAVNAHYVVFEVGENVSAFIQKDQNWYKATVLGVNNTSVYVKLKGRGKIWIHRSNIDKL